MPECRICKHTFKSLRFKTEHVQICTRCVNTLNDNPEPAREAERRWRERLMRGMERKATADLESPEPWKRQRAQADLANLGAAADARLHDWITSLLKDTSNSTRDFKIMRAHRRGMLRQHGLADYPGDWIEVARNIRQRDKNRCTQCGAQGVVLDVHHIVYLSHHGTNQQSNLVTLCRDCHQKEHGRAFDWEESNDPESPYPIQPPAGMSPPSTLQSIRAVIPTPPTALPPAAAHIRATPQQWASTRAEMSAPPPAIPAPPPTLAIEDKTSIHLAKTIEQPTPSPVKTATPPKKARSIVHTWLIDAAIIAIFMIFVFLVAIFQ